MKQAMIKHKKHGSNLLLSERKLKPNLKARRSISIDVKELEFSMLDKPRNIIQLKRDSKNIQALYRQWKEDASIETIDVLLAKINALVDELKWTIYHGIVPTNPKKELSDLTIKILEAHMSKLLAISLDIKNVTSIKAKLLSCRYERVNYREVTDDYPATSVEDIQIPHMLSSGEPTMGKRGISRNFSTKI